MSEPYLIPAGTGTGYYEEKRSRFPATLQPVRSEEEAQQLLAAERKKSYDARHHCWAYVLGSRNEICRFSDDGEPSGTAGRPILDVLLGSGLHNAMIIVVRYFGGTLLGTGGLVRAYTAAARDAVAGTKTATVRPVKKAGISCAYTDLARIDKLIQEDSSFFAGERVYSDTASLTVYLPQEKAERFAAAVGDAASGRAKLEFLGDTGILTDKERFLGEYEAL